MVPRWDDDVHGFVDPDTGEELPTFDDAADQLDQPAHVVRLGPQVHVKGILGGTEEAGRHIGYLTKYLTKSVSQAAGLAQDLTDRQREHRRRLVAELQRTPCSPGCPIWLLYGVQPRKVRHTAVPGVCKSKAHRPNTSASPGAASSCPASGRTRPSRSTTPSGPRSFGNC